MVCGIAILGTVTATLASWIVERVSEASDDAAAASRELSALRAEVAELRELLLRHGAADPPTESG